MPPFGAAAEAFATISYGNQNGPIGSAVSADRERETSLLHKRMQPDLDARALRDWLQTSQ